MATTRTPGITVLADGRRFIDKRYLGVRIGLRVGTVTQEQAEERLRTEMGRVECAMARKAPFRPTFTDVMFYASDTAQTALRETASSRGPGTYVVATFVVTRPLVVLDLAELPPIPSIFEPVSDSVEYDPRKTLQFLHEVAMAISQLVPRDGREHVEYVPTQVVTEFMRSRQRTPIDGIQYTSAVDGGNSFVLFADQSNLVPTGGATEKEQWLKLEGRAERVVSQADIDGWRPIGDFS